MYHSYKPITLTDVLFPAVTICPGLNVGETGELNNEAKIEEGKMKFEDLSDFEFVVPGFD